MSEALIKLLYAVKLFELLTQEVHNSRGKLFCSARTRELYIAEEIVSSVFVYLLIHSLRPTRLVSC